MSLQLVGVVSFAFKTFYFICQTVYQSLKQFEWFVNYKYRSTPNSGVKANIKAKTGSSAILQQFHPIRRIHHVFTSGNTKAIAKMVDRPPSDDPSISMSTPSNPAQCTFFSSASSREFFDQLRLIVRNGTAGR